MNDKEIAKIILSCIDLTSLNSNDSLFKIESLVESAKTPYGDVAALCVYPKFIPALVNKTDINIATVINFPKGRDNVHKIKKDIASAITEGAVEVDVVFPYTDYLNKEYSKVDEFLMMIHSLNKDITSKVILETSELGGLNKIIDATKLCLEAGAGFIKTSTGKASGGATPEIANVILETIADYPKKAGFKASGGVKTFEEARRYVVLAQSIMGRDWVNSNNFRIGASSLLAEVIKCLSKI
ncbi:MAG: deoxyribose-phosphate aldolase [Alphaproteobacteria bacterium]